MSTFKWLRLTIVFFLVIPGCGKPLPNLEDIDLQKWKDDKHGCSGTRSTMMSSITSQSEKLLSLSESEIISLLGKPDENELYKRNQKFYYYLLEPSKTCSDTISADPRKLVIRFNAVGLAKEVVVE